MLWPRKIFRILLFVWTKNSMLIQQKVRFLPHDKWVAFWNNFCFETYAIRVFSICPVDTGRKLNVHKTFRRRPGCLLDVLCTFNLRLVSTRWRSFAEGVNVEKNDPCYSYNLFLLILPQFIINNNLYSHFCHILLFYYIIIYSLLLILLYFVIVLFLLEFSITFMLFVLLIILLFHLSL